jgi:hypothetical protein
LLAQLNDKDAPGKEKEMHHEFSQNADNQVGVMEGVEA